MLRTLMLLLALGLSTQAYAYDCDKLSDKDPPSVLLGCVESARDLSSATLKALDAARSIAINPTSVLDFVDLAAVRSSPYDLDKAARSIHQNLEALLGPETRFSYAMRRMGLTTTTEPFMLLRKLYASEATFREWFVAAEPKIVELIARFSIQGALISGGERLKPILEKPADALLAQKGMKWMFELRCTDEEVRKPACDTSTFPSEFKSYYGAEATEENVWWLGFLNRRDLEHRGMSAKLQKMAMDFLHKIDKQE